MIPGKPIRHWEELSVLHRTERSDEEAIDLANKTFRALNKKYDVRVYITETIEHNTIEIKSEKGSS